MSRAQLKHYLSVQEDHRREAFLEACRVWQARLEDLCPMASITDPSGAWEALEAMIRFFTTPADEGDPVEIAGRLTIREFPHPHESLLPILSESLRPIGDRLGRICRWLRPDLGVREMDALVSVLASILLYPTFSRGAAAYVAFGPAPPELLISVVRTLIEHYENGGPASPGASGV